MARHKTELDEKIDALGIEVDQLETKLTEAERLTAAATEEEGEWKAATIAFYETNEKQGQWLEDIRAEIKKIKLDQIDSDKELKETTDELIRKMAIIDDLEKQWKQLLEEKTDLQNRLEQLLQQAGKTVAASVPVTPIKEKARVAPPVVDIGLEGLITTVDLENSLAEISIGAANGVKQNMKFHVTRGDEFICDILILDVEPEKAVGTLELMDVTQKQPKAGDNVSTNL